MKVGLFRLMLDYSDRSQKRVNVPVNTREKVLQRYPQKPRIPTWLYFW